MDYLLNKIKELYEQNGCMHIYNHSLQVAKKAVELADRFNVEDTIKNNVYVAALLHDVGGIYPNDQRIKMAKQYGIELVAEEYAFPLIIHQKISRYLSQEYFEIENTNILDSIECHTTLRKHYRIEDLIVFLADKIAWDQSGNPPYLDGLLKQLHCSLEEAALFYIDYILSHGVKVIHPWLSDAKLELERHIVRGEVYRLKRQFESKEQYTTPD